MPRTTITPEGISLLCFPPLDQAFAETTRRTYDALGSKSVDELQARLREIYPHVVVRPQDALAAFGASAAWYIYRDGRYSPFADEGAWWQEDDTPRLVIDDEGRYVDANPAALALLNVDLDGLRGSVPGDFTDPAHREMVSWLHELLKETGLLHSTSVLVPRAGRTPFAVEYRYVRDGDGPGRHASIFRPMPIDGASAGPGAPADQAAPALGES